MSGDILTLAPPPADARIGYGSDPNQFFDLREPTAKAVKTVYPLVINIHGGFWRARYSLTHAGHLCAALTRKGLITANLEYRRVGNEGGGWPASVSDICAAYDFIVQHSLEHSVDPQRILVMGHSAGAQLALLLAARKPNLKGVISLAGVVDLHRAYDLHLSNDAVARFLGGSSDEVPDNYREADPMQLSVKGICQVLFHGLKDEEVPPELSRDYVANKKEKENVQLVEIPEADHYDLIDPRTRAWRRVEETALQLLH